MPFTQESLEAFKRDGYILLPNTLTTEELDSLRKTCLDHLGEKACFEDCGVTQPDAFGQIAGMRWLLKHPKIVEAFRFYCGDDLKYCHHSDVHLNKITGWHKDSCGANDFAPEDGKDYGVYKMAFYLQDHSNGPTALKVCAGSHLSKNLHEGPVVELRPKVGDSILFDCRISHCGQDLSVPMKVVRNLMPKSMRSKFFITLRKLQGQKDKLSVFFTLGRQNRFLDEHVKITVKRQLRSIGESEYVMPEEVAETISQAGWGYANVHV